LINFILTNYGPNGTVNPGLVVSVSLGMDGNSVWWTYNDGLRSAVADVVPGVGGSGLSNNKKSVADKSKAAQPAPAQSEGPSHDPGRAPNQQPSSKAPVSPQAPPSQAPAEQL
jgi:hypothetical protein